MDWIPFLIVGAGGSIFINQYPMIPNMRSLQALDFRQWIGGEAKIFDYCHNLALEGGRRMAEIFGTQVMDPNGEFTLNMVRSSFVSVLLENRAILTRSTSNSRSLALFLFLLKSTSYSCINY